MSGIGKEPQEFTVEELKRLRRLLRVFPDDEAIEDAEEFFTTYRALGHLGKIAVGALKVIAVVSAGVIAWLHLRGIWTGKGS